MLVSLTWRLCMSLDIDLRVSTVLEMIVAAMAQHAFSHL